MNLQITVEDSAWTALQDLESVAEAAAQQAMPHGDERSVALLFSNDAEIRSLNHHWRGQDKPTNVLSFPAAPIPVPKGEPAPLGDVVLAFETVAREAAESGKSLAHHTTHLIVHGILHLLGYDHENDADAQIMEDKERGILARLGIADPYES